MNVQETILFMRQAHAGQFDKAGKPYHLHPERVRERLVAMIGNVSLEAQKAALLHDVVEDTEHDAESLLAHGFDKLTVSIVLEVTRDKSDGLTYMQWIKRLADSGSRDAILVKLADNMDNSDPERLEALQEGAESMAKRYLRARKLLWQGLETRFGTGDLTLPIAVGKSSL